MIQMVEHLEMKMIAEGVETVGQAKFLHDQGCSEMQGYYFFKPMPVEKFERVMKEAADRPYEDNQLGDNSGA
jgi:EAL domain-containing protein (putative c-di-GMP-specific phosphodiesterase class I)